MKIDKRFSIFLLVGLLSGCIHTKAGTHVELVEQDGVDVYVSGAAGPGINYNNIRR